MNEIFMEWFGLIKSMILMSGYEIYDIDTSVLHIWCFLSYTFIFIYLYLFIFVYFGCLIPLFQSLYMGVAVGGCEWVWVDLGRCTIY